MVSFWVWILCLRYLSRDLVGRGRSHCLRVVRILRSWIEEAQMLMSVREQYLGQYIALVGVMVLQADNHHRKVLENIRSGSVRRLVACRADIEQRRFPLQRAAFAHPGLAGILLLVAT